MLRIQSFKVPTWAAAGLVLVVFTGSALAQAPAIPTSHPRILLVGTELQRLRADLAANSPAAVRFRTMVNTAVAGGTGNAGIYNYEPWFSAMMGVITTSPAERATYCNHAVPQVEAIVASEETYINAGQRPDVSGDSYLDAGYYVGNVALIHDWCNEFVTAAQKTRWLNYASRAVTNIWSPDNATWGGVSHPWNGWSIDNPVNNYYYSFLRATMLYGIAAKYERADADTWVNHFRNVKIRDQLVPTFNADLVGGGSREGTGYGSAMRGLFNLYYLWEKSTGERIADLTPHTADSMHYLTHMIVPTRDRFAPIGDHARDETATFYDYQREGLLGLAALYRGTPLARRVRAELALTNVPVMGSQFNFVYDYLYGDSDPGAAANLNTVYRSPGTGHLFARTDWSKTATWLGFISGPYTESHGHPDGLSFLLFKNGWLINDANMQSRSGIYADQRAHALVTQQVGGQLLDMYQPPTSTAVTTALSQRENYLYVSANAGTLFENPNTGNPGVQSNREMVFVYPNTTIIFDRVRYVPGTSIKTFQLPTPYLPTITGRTATLSNGTSSLKLFAIAPTAATISSKRMWEIDPDPSNPNFPAAGGDGYRLDVAITSSGETKFMNVLSIDSAVTTATGSQIDSGDLTLALADGRTVILKFNANAPGGTIEIRNSGGQIVVNENLATGVTNPPPILPVNYQLMVTKSGTGSGTVSAQPSGINCGATCAAPYESGTLVTLTATPNFGSNFTGWNGGGCSGTANCQVSVTAATTVTATFAPIPATAPSAPQQVVAIAGDGRAYLTFLPPLADGFSPVTSYRAVCNPNAVEVNGTTSPLVVTGLSNGTAYQCTVRAINLIDEGAPSASVSVMPQQNPLFALVAVTSRKVHGSAGTFDLPIDHTQTIAGPVSVEPRAIGSAHVIAFRFNQLVNAVGGVSVVDKLGTDVGSANRGFNGEEAIITMTGIADNQRVQINLSGVNGVFATTAAMGFLVGDVSNSRIATASDISGVKSRLGKPLTQVNFMFDINATGAIDGADVASVKARAGKRIP